MFSFTTNKLSQHFTLPINKHNPIPNTHKSQESQLNFYIQIELPNIQNVITPQMAPFLIFTILSFLSITGRAEYREHGLKNESPMAFSPQAVTFFHPKSLQPNEVPGPSLPLAASVESTPAHESKSSHEKGQLGAGTIIAISLGFVSAGLAAMGAYYVVNKRQANLQRANHEQPLQA